MDTLPDQIFYPESFNELFSVWNHFPKAVPFAGGSDLIRKQGNNIINLPGVVLCLDNLEELNRITRTEHYLEIGAMVKINRILRLGKIVPEILRTCADNIAGVQVRNIATVGGNLCSTSHMYDLPAPLTALDAQYELRNTHNTRWVSASRFHSADEHTDLQNQELLTRIRLPLHHWDYSIYKKFYRNDIFSSEVLVFLAKAQKNVLTDIRIVYKTAKILRNRNGEDILNGKILPLHRKTAHDFIENWKTFLENKTDISEFSKNALINNIEENVFLLSE
ncbi:MAG: FAD binding domain-containing protein [Treponema sp.]|nr:FAD binding domain-containing protein [Treponema sp.]MCL2272318.1 FAD binding domain-containing protein [Treponema sp.]